MRENLLAGMAWLWLVAWALGSAPGLAEAHAAAMQTDTSAQTAGYYKGSCHGVFDGATEYAVKRFQRAWGLPVMGLIGWQDYVALGLIE